VGVAGGATRAALTQHQARRNNMAGIYSWMISKKTHNFENSHLSWNWGRMCEKFLLDVSAKDGSQETAIGLLGMLLAIVVTPLVGDSQFLIWLCFWLFTIFHLYANYKAVTSVVMERLNRQRTDILIDAFLASNQSLVLFTVVPLHTHTHSHSHSHIHKKGWLNENVFLTNWTDKFFLLLKKWFLLHWRCQKERR
jgi:hypothetical protein